MRESYLSFKVVSTVLHILSSCLASFSFCLLYHTFYSVRADIFLMSIKMNQHFTFVKYVCHWFLKCMHEYIWEQNMWQKCYCYLHLPHRVVVGILCLLNFKYISFFLTVLLHLYFPLYWFHQNVNKTLKYIYYLYSIFLIYIYFIYILKLINNHLLFEQKMLFMKHINFVELWRKFSVYPTLLWQKKFIKQTVL